VCAGIALYCLFFLPFFFCCTLKNFYETQLFSFALVFKYYYKFLNNIFFNYYAFDLKIIIVIVATQFLTHVLIIFQKNPKIAKKH
jgi:predicted acylesterase/phospholipase RssA